MPSTATHESRITIQPYATGADAKRFFSHLAVIGSRISSAGTCEVPTIALDEALAGVAPTCLKFEIEGSGPDAPEGGRETIALHRPKMAVCLYHAPNHL
jgi:hypothetical protein